MRVKYVHGFTVSCVVPFLFSLNYKLCMFFNNLYLEKHCLVYTTEIVSSVTLIADDIKIKIKKKTSVTLPHVQYQFFLIKRFSDT